MYVPPNVWTNRKLAAELLKRREDLINQKKFITPEQRERFETSDEWIRERTGIRERHIANPEEATSDMAIKAAQNAMRKANLNPTDTEFLIVATVSPDHLFSPPTAAIVQSKLGLSTDTFISDVSVACSSFVCALAIGFSLIKSGVYKRGVVIGADTMSRNVNWNDRTFSVIMADGAGALVLERSNETPFIQRPFLFGSDGNLAPLICTPTGGSRQPFSPETMKTVIENPVFQSHTATMNGRELLKLMARLVPEKIKEAVERADLKWSDLDLFIPHQANLRIIDAIKKRLEKYPGFRAKVFINIDRYGNTTSASIPICIYEALEQGLLKSGSKIMLVGFGGGISWGTVTFKWPILG